MSNEKIFLFGSDVIVAPKFRRLLIDLFLLLLCLRQRIDKHMTYMAFSGSQYQKVNTELVHTTLIINRDNRRDSPDRQLHFNHAETTTTTTTITVQR